MKKLHVIVVIFLMFAGLAKAQTINEQAAISSELNKTQKDILVNTWYESPKESSANKIVYTLTEYVMVAGQDYYNFGPGKLALLNTKKFTSENLKVKQNVDPKLSESGNWSLKGNKLILDLGSNKNTFTISSIENNKLVLIID